MLNKKLEYRICEALQQFSVSGLLKGEIWVCIYEEIVMAAGVRIGYIRTPAVLKNIS